MKDEQVDVELVQVQVELAVMTIGHLEKNKIHPMTTMMIEHSAAVDQKIEMEMFSIRAQPLERFNRIRHRNHRKANKIHRILNKNVSRTIRNHFDFL